MAMDVKGLQVHCRDHDREEPMPTACQQTHTDGTFRPRGLCHTGLCLRLMQHDRLTCGLVPEVMSRHGSSLATPCRQHIIQVLQQITHMTPPLQAGMLPEQVC